MASSLSRGSRPIGPVYNDTKRAARKLEREGYGRAAEALALQAAQQKLARGGSNITSAESNRDERDALEVAQSGLMRERADVAFRADAAEKGLTVEASGAQLTARKGLYERMRSGITPEMKAEAGKLGITDSGFAQASASAAKNSLTRPAVAAGGMAPAPVVGGVAAPTTLTRSNPNGNANAPAVTVDAYGNTTAPADNPSTLPSLTRPASDTALPTRETAPRTFAERDAVMKSAMAASADGTNGRTRQDVVDEANKARIAEGKIPFDDSIYSEMSKMDVNKRDGALVAARNARIAEKVGRDIAAETAEAAPKRALTAEEKAAADTYGITYSPSESPPVGGKAADPLPTFAASPEAREKARQDTAPGGSLNPNPTAPPERGFLHSLGATLKKANDMRSSSGPASSPTLNRKQEVTASAIDASAATELAVGGATIGTARKLKRGVRDFRDGLSGSR